MRPGLSRSMQTCWRGISAGRPKRCGNRRWQAIVEPDGAVVSEHVEFVPLRTGKVEGI
jgi:hypothetical protein